VVVAFAVTAIGLPMVPAPARAEGPVRGLDVSAAQGAVDWRAVKAAGASFAYVKATEGAGYVNEDFAQQYNGSYDVGLIRGAYHFALPDRTGGAQQADYFIAHGGGWSADGRTLPGALDIEYNPYGATCYGKSAADMVAWLHDFLDRYRARTSRDAMIYTTTNWWQVCTGDSAAFSAHPFWLACYCGSVGGLPASARWHTIWQFASDGTFPGDQNIFNGSLDRLVVLARGAEAGPAPSPSVPRPRSPSPSPNRSTAGPSPGRSSTSPGPSSAEPGASTGTTAPDVSGSAPVADATAATATAAASAAATAGGLFAAGLALIGGAGLVLLAWRRRRRRPRVVPAGPESGRQP
jgi:GH25 family lysozyme M1 (1,4-beta-N-acetylmuramidase)